ncbi:sulfotransferase 4A1 isoform X1 [Scyliorhinus canicula]|uniref:sulfotransferase 4A1 isoform X1 n=1 Tax=Scyliorhinus canicula TaxID=7830 RepID=UPI0018F508EE|nr:sulfotransferase 4A1 isoform X1 [Scyliorhinus canicula]
MAESEAETPSTPGEFGSKYFEYNGVRLPPFCRGKMDEIANFPVRESDIWIVTYPKSGTSLLQELVYLVNQDADPDEIGIMNIDEQLPVLEYPQPGLDIIKELTSPRLIKSHLPYRFLPTDLHNGQSKVICMARNPKDLVVSYYQFHRSLRTMSYRGTFQEFCRRFMNDKLGYGSWFEHVQEFWVHRMDSNVLFLLYEDMHKNLAGTVELLVRFLGVSYDKTQMESVIEHCHQLVDQYCNAEALSIGRDCFMRRLHFHHEEYECTSTDILLVTLLLFLLTFLSYSEDFCFCCFHGFWQASDLFTQAGRVGLWKDIFTVSMNEKFDAVFKLKMGKSDLSFDFSL